MATKQKATVLVGDWKLYVALAAVVGVAGVALATMGPTLATVVSFFWPLVVSTVFLLSAVALLFRISPPPSDPHNEEVPGQELMQYVAGCHDEVPLEMAARPEWVSRPREEAEEGEKRVEEKSDESEKMVEEQRREEQ